MSSLRVLLVLFLLTQQTFAANKSTLAPVTVSKCCRIGESIRYDSEAFLCDPGASSHWLPRIYAPRRRGYLPPGLPPHWTISEAQYPACPIHQKQTMIRSSTNQPNFVLFANGSLWLQETKSMLNPVSYCVDSSEAAVVCLPTEDPPSTLIESTEVSLPVKRIKVKKCCGENASYNEKTHTCVIVVGGPQLQADDIKLMGDGESGMNGSVGVQLIEGFPICSSRDVGMVIAGALNEAALKPDGSLIVSSAGVELVQEHFCLELVKEQRDASVFACSESVPDQNPGIDRSDLRFTLYPVGLLVSTIFLMATLAAAILLRSTHHALHWRCQMHYIACLLVGDLMLAITQLAGNTISGTPCIMIGN